MYQSFYEKIIKTREILWHLTRANNLQQNRTNHDFLAQFFKKLQQNNGKHFLHCLDPTFMSICNGSSCSHNPTSPNKSGSFIFRARVTWGPSAPSNKQKYQYQSFLQHGFKKWWQNQIVVAKSLL